MPRFWLMLELSAQAVEAREKPKANLFVSKAKNANPTTSAKSRQKTSKSRKPRLDGQQTNSKSFDEKAKNSFDNFTHTETALGIAEPILRKIQQPSEDQRGTSNGQIYLGNEGGVQDREHISRELEGSSWKDTGRSVSSICETSRVDCEKLDHTDLRITGVAEEAPGWECGNRLEESNGHEVAPFEVHYPAPNTVDQQFLHSSIFPGGKTWRSTTDRERHHNQHEERNNIHSLEKTQNRDKDRDEKSPSIHTAEVVHADKETMDKQVFDNQPERNTRSIEATGTVETLGETRWSTMEIQASQQECGENDGSVTPHDTDSTAELPRRERRHLIRKRLSFPLMFFGISEYEYGFEQWLRQVGIEKRDLKGEQHLRYLQLSATRLNSRSVNSLMPSAGETGQPGDEIRWEGCTDHTPYESKDFIDHLSVSKTEPLVGSKKLPLYTPTMTPINLDLIRTWASEKERRTLDWLTEDNLYHKALRDLPKESRKLYELSKVMPFFAFTCNRKLYYICRLAMGFSAAVCVGNTISRIILHQTFRRLGLTTVMEHHGFMIASNSNRQISATTQVDNSYIFSGQEDVNNTLLQVINEAAVLIGEHSIENEGDILGMHFSIKPPGTTVNLTKRFIEKHSEFLLQVENKIPCWVFWRANAILFRGLAILQYKLCFVYGLMFDVRCVARRIFDGSIIWTDVFEMTPLAWAQFDVARKLVLRNKAVVTPMWAADGHSIFSDASDKGAGVVIAGPQYNMVQSCSWEELSPKHLECHIGEKEATALAMAVQLAIELKLSAPTFITDASALFFSCLKGLNKNFKVNSVVAKLKYNFPSSVVLWVCSACNPADAPSRGALADAATTEEMLGWSQNELNNLQRTTGMPVYRSTPNQAGEMGYDLWNPFYFLEKRND